MNRQRVLSLLLALVMVLGSFGIVAASEANENATNDQKIQWLKDQEIVVGRKVNENAEDNDIALEENVTRAEITKLIVHTIGQADLAEALDGVVKPFPDVERTHWANGFISVAVTERASNDNNDNGLIIGYEDGEFKPSRDVTYAELATMLVRLVKDDLTKADEDRAIWATDYMRWAEEEGILEGLTIADSNAKVDRYDAFVMIYNAIYEYNGLDIKDVNFGDDLGIVSKLGNGEIQINQDEERVYKIDSNTLLTDGTTWKSLADNIDGVNRGSLVRLIVNANDEVTHLIELGNPRQGAFEAARWIDVAEEVEGVGDAGAEATFRTDASGKYVDITVDGVEAEIDGDTRFFVADVDNNALREVDSIAEAFRIFNIDGKKVEKVYMGYDEEDAILGEKTNVAKVIVFNDIENYFGDKNVVRITEKLATNYKFRAEDTKGNVDLYDVSNLPLFPSNDLIDARDVVEITDNPNVQRRAELIKINYSEDDVFRVNDLEGREIQLVDEYGYARVFRIARDNHVFLEDQLKKDAHVQVEFNDDKEIEIISVVDKDLKGSIEDGFRIGTDSGYIAAKSEDGTTVSIAEDIVNGNYVRQTTYEVADTDTETIQDLEVGTEIVFDIGTKFGDTDYIYNVEVLNEQEEIGQLPEETDPEETDPEVTDPEEPETPDAHVELPSVEGLNADAVQAINNYVNNPDDRRLKIARELIDEAPVGEREALTNALNTAVANAAIDEYIEAEEKGELYPAARTAIDEAPEALQEALEERLGNAVVAELRAQFDEAVEAYRNNPNAETVNALAGKRDAFIDSSYTTAEQEEELRAEYRNVTNAIQREIVEKAINAFAENRTEGALETANEQINKLPAAEREAYLTQLEDIGPALDDDGTPVTESEDTNTEEEAGA